MPTLLPYKSSRKKKERGREWEGNTEEIGKKEEDNRGKRIGEGRRGKYSSNHRRCLYERLNELILMILWHLRFYDRSLTFLKTFEKLLSEPF